MAKIPITYAGSFMEWFFNAGQKQHLKEFSVVFLWCSNRAGRIRFFVLVWKGDSEQKRRLAQWSETASFYPF
jgi:hypothetical protein